MYVLDESVVLSASDITEAGTCEFGFLRRFDLKLGRDVEVPRGEDAMLERAARLGDQHELRQLQAYRGLYGPERVTEIARPTDMTRAGVEERARETTRALRSANTDVIFQATFFDPELRAPKSSDEPTIAFIGFADFLEARRDDAGRVAWQVQDTKLARRARVAALVQIAAYGEQVERAGARVDTHGVLMLGDGSRSSHRLSDISPVYRARRTRLIELVLSAWSRDDITRWGDREVHACGRCEVCEPEVLRTRDPLLVAGMSLRQRSVLRDANITTIDALAATDPQASIPGMTSSVFQRLSEQARVQVESEASGIPAVRVVKALELQAIPEPDQGDLFFDFEGDPMHRELRDDGTPAWGLDYLFGMVDVAETFTPMWAHSLSEERQALIDFLALVRERRRRFPGMHVYHYASYERSHLLSIAARHGVGEDEVDELLRKQVLVDLYPIVRRALRIGSRSYSIKKLEPLYMGDEFRDEAGVVDGAQSVSEYAEVARLLRSPEASDRAEAHERLNAIADYNRYDCVSTLRLRDWLLSLAEQHGVTPGPREPDPSLSDTQAGEPGHEPSAVGARLLELAESKEDPAEARALRLSASAIDFHRREHKSFWWAHFARLSDPVEDWADTRDVVVVEPSVSRVLEDWHLPPRARKERRHLELRGSIAPGSSLTEGQKMFALYEWPAPYPDARQTVGERSAKEVTVVKRFEGGVVIEEMLPDGAEGWQTFPAALTPGQPPHARGQKDAIEEWGSALADAVSAGSEFRDPVFDLIRRKPPRLVGGVPPVSPASDEALREVGGDDDSRTIGAVVATLRKLDRSYLAVQGPPGTGKTFLASRVIRRLVEQYGWRIGVVAQSHKVVEHVLDGVIHAGLAAEFVGKVPQSGRHGSVSRTPSWTVLKSNGHAEFLDLASRSGRGAVIGGTAWDFSNPARCGRGELDLLVIDEAGQFSLAPTIAASVAAQRVLLLGDPQQLPQVSQGSHPEPVDTSALGWLIDDHDTLPESLGYFLEFTRRMHPALTEVVSELSYEGRLRAHTSTAEREVRGATPPGLMWHPVPHEGNATFSEQEAAEVVRLVAQSLRGTVAGSGTPERAMTEADIIVVAAYNAQVECVSRALQRAGLPDVRVGTVDRFQGQEAVIAIVTLAASSPNDVPRGLEFLLMRNRLNVAISRAQWGAHLVSSPSLGGTGLPTSTAEVTALSGYLFLTEVGAIPHDEQPQSRNEENQVR